MAIWNRLISKYINRCVRKQSALFQHNIFLKKDGNGKGLVFLSITDAVTISLQFDGTLTQEHNFVGFVYCISS